MPTRVLAEAVVHFPQTLAEVTLAAGPGGRISLRSYVEDEAGEWGAGGWPGGAFPPRVPNGLPAELGKAMVTELWLAPDEFQAVAVVPDSRITFCLKEFRVSRSQGPPPNVLPPLTRWGLTRSHLRPGTPDFRRGLQLAPHHPLRRARQVGAATLAAPLCFPNCA